jgi:hypothetical protein
MSPSFTQWSSDSDNVRPPTATETFVAQRSVYAAANGEFAHARATAAAAMRSRPLEALVRANSRNGASKRSTGRTEADVTARRYRKKRH